MGNKSKESDSAVKIDSLLLSEVEKFIKKEENRFKFANKKQFIDNAVYEFLRKMKGEVKNDKG